ncbi:MAG TPA: caspase family protein [Thermoanaerobaculia bacterium]
MAQTDRALLIGISDYEGKAPRLDSPEREIEEWRDLLIEEYGFQYGDIRLLANDRARRDEILHRLEWLFGDAQPNDRRVLYLAGHGVRIRRRDTRGEILDGLDEAFLAHPSALTDDVETMAIFDDELFAVYAGSSAAAARVTWILDCCHGGGFNSQDMPRQPRVMSVTPPVDLRHRSFDHQFPRRNGLSDRGVQMPVIVNAAGELNLSIELVLGGERRSLFSFYALEMLRKEPKITYRRLIEQLRAIIDPQYPQHTNVRGDRRRQDASFLQ